MSELRSLASLSGAMLFLPQVYLCACPIQTLARRLSWWLPLPHGTSPPLVSVPSGSLAHDLPTGFGCLCCSGVHSAPRLTSHSAQTQHWTGGQDLYHMGRQFLELSEFNMNSHVKYFGGFLVL